jgi:hypothetical protein
MLVISNITSKYQLFIDNISAYSCPPHRVNSKIVYKSLLINLINIYLIILILVRFQLSHVC